MKPRRSGPGCGCLLFCLVLLLGTGVAIPKLTARDPAPVNAVLRSCAMDDLAKTYDRPYEQAALALGQSRVTASSTSVAEVEAYTLFRLPLSLLRGRLELKRSVDCSHEVSGLPKGCDLSTLCLQESQGEGLFGVAQVQAYLLGKKTFDDPANPKLKDACYQMRITSTNDQRVINELGSNDFVVSDEMATHFKSLTDSSAPASLLIYIKERVGSDAGPCDQRVRILN